MHVKDGHELFWCKIHPANFATLSVISELGPPDRHIDKQMNKRMDESVAITVFCRNLSFGGHRTAYIHEMMERE